MTILENSLKPLNPTASIYLPKAHLQVNIASQEKASQEMKEINIFDVLTRQGGTIHDIAIEAASAVKIRWQQGLLCYRFVVDGKAFDGCIDGWLITEIPDKHLPGCNIVRIIIAEQKQIIESHIFPANL